MKKLYKFVAGVGKVEMTEEEIKALETSEEQDIPVTAKIDKLTALIEGLSSATTLAQIRKIAKDILEKTNEGEVYEDGDS